MVEALAWFALLAAQAVHAQEEIRIGAPLALTGALADEGHKQRIAYELWLDRVNAAGGISVKAADQKLRTLNSKDPS